MLLLVVAALLAESIEATRTDLVVEADTKRSLSVALAQLTSQEPAWYALAQA